jgi:hypothetical protein
VKPSESAPAALGKYIVSGEIARGGVGVVLLGRDGDIGRDVAVKLRPSVQIRPILDMPLGERDR